MSKASTSTGIPYITLLYAKKNSRNQVRSNGKEYTIIYPLVKGSCSDPGAPVGPINATQ